jgi:uncharacterized membrane protein
MRSAMRANADLISIGLAALAAVVSALGPPGPLRVVLGLTLSLFLPGYGLSAALYAKVNDLRWPERIALSVGSSLVLLVLIALAVSYSPWARDPQSTALALGGVTILCALAAWLHRAAVGSEGPCSGWNGWAPLPVSRSIIVTFAVVVVLAVGLSWLGRPTPSEAYTAFFALRSDGTSDPYVIARGYISIILDVSNHEGHRVSYRVEVLRDGAAVADMHTTVANGAIWRHRLSIAMPGAEGGQLQMLLFRKDRPHHVYRILRLRPARP